MNEKNPYFNGRGGASGPSRFNHLWLGFLSHPKSIQNFKARISFQAKIGNDPEGQGSAGERARNSEPVAGLAAGQQRAF